jgi:CBS domain-containing protein
LFTEKGITAAPVIDDSGHPIGVISRSDLLIHQCQDQK